jgi:hypothetical protein
MSALPQRTDVVGEAGYVGFVPVTDTQVVNWSPEQ